ncbi:unnamed protein product [Rotaria socialis]
MACISKMLTLEIHFPASSETDDPYFEYFPGLELMEQWHKEFEKIIYVTMTNGEHEVSLRNAVRRAKLNDQFKAMRAKRDRRLQ